MSDCTVFSKFSRQMKLGSSLAAGKIRRRLKSNVIRVMKKCCQCWDIDRACLCKFLSLRIEIASKERFVLLTKHRNENFGYFMPVYISLFTLNILYISRQILLLSIYFTRLDTFSSFLFLFLFALNISYVVYIPFTLFKHRNVVFVRLNFLRMHKHLQSSDKEMFFIQLRGWLAIHEYFQTKINQVILHDSSETRS